MKTSEQRHWRRSGDFIINLNIFKTFFSVYFVGFDQANVCWEDCET